MRLFVLFFLLLVACTANAAEIIFPFESTIPYLLDGDGWKTVITVVNLEDTAATFSLRFYTPTGALTEYPTNLGSTNTITQTLPARGSVTIETLGTNTALSQGWAYLDTTFIVGGTAIFRKTVPGLPPLESSEPLSATIYNRMAFAFDNTGGGGTGLAVVNSIMDTTATVFLVFRAEDGTQFFVDSFALPPLNSTSFTVADRYPQTAGKRGTFELATSAFWITGLAVHVTPSGSFTAITPLVSIDWVP